MQVVSVSELSPELSLIVTATGKETCASLSVIISCHLSRQVGQKFSYLLDYYSVSMAPAGLEIDNKRVKNNRYPILQKNKD